jgi:hypothetical protein
LSYLHLGRKIGIVGFIRGKENQLIKLNDGSGLHQQFIKYGPILHSGIISGFAPNTPHWYEFNVSNDVTQILTDLNVGSGLSGAPVFDWETLEIIGIHFASHKGNGGQNIGFTIPLTKERVEHLALISIAHTIGIAIPKGQANIFGSLAIELKEKIYRLAKITQICS